MEWLNIPAYPDYQVSDEGQVRSLDRVFINARGQVRSIRGKLLKPLYRPNGYTHVYLSRDTEQGRERIRVSLHRLVYSVFVGELVKGMHVMHLDGKKDNNCLSNLKQGTSSENNSMKSKHGTSNNHRVFNDSQREVIRAKFRLNPKLNQSALARQLHCSATTLIRIRDEVQV